MTASSPLPWKRAIHPLAGAVVPGPAAAASLFTHPLPLVTAASNAGQQGFVRHQPPDARRPGAWPGS